MRNPRHPNPHLRVSGRRREQGLFMEALPAIAADERKLRLAMKIGGAYTMLPSYNTWGSRWVAVKVPSLRELMRSPIPLSLRLLT